MKRKKSTKETRNTKKQKSITTENNDLGGPSEIFADQNVIQESAGKNNTCNNETSEDSNNSKKRRSTSAGKKSTCNNETSDDSSNSKKRRSTREKKFTWKKQEYDESKYEIISPTKWHISNSETRKTKKQKLITTENNDLAGQSEIFGDQNVIQESAGKKNTCNNETSEDSNNSKKRRSTSAGKKSTCNNETSDDSSNSKKRRSTSAGKKNTCNNKTSDDSSNSKKRRSTSAGKKKKCNNDTSDDSSNSEKRRSTPLESEKSSTKLDQNDISVSNENINVNINSDNNESNHVQNVDSNDAVVKINLYLNNITNSKQATLVPMNNPSNFNVVNVFINPERTDVYNNNNNNTQVKQEHIEKPSDDIELNKSETTNMDVNNTMQNQEPIHLTSENINTPEVDINIPEITGTDVNNTIQNQEEPIHLTSENINTPEVDINTPEITGTIELIKAGEVNNLIKQDTEDLNSKLKSSLNKIVSLETTEDGKTIVKQEWPIKNENFVCPSDILVNNENQNKQKPIDSIFVDIPTPEINKTVPMMNPTEKEPESSGSQLKSNLNQNLLPGTTEDSKPVLMPKELVLNENYVYPFDLQMNSYNQKQEPIDLTSEDIVSPTPETTDVNEAALHKYQNKTSMNQGLLKVVPISSLIEQETVDSNFQFKSSLNQNISPIVTNDGKTIRKPEVPISHENYVYPFDAHVNYNQKPQHLIDLTSEDIITPEVFIKPEIIDITQSRELFDLTYESDGSSDLEWIDDTQSRELFDLTNESDGSSDLELIDEKPSCSYTIDGFQQTHHSVPSSSFVDLTQYCSVDKGKKIKCEPKECDALIKLEDSKLAQFDRKPVYPLTSSFSPPQSSLNPWLPSDQKVVKRELISEQGTLCDELGRTQQQTTSHNQAHNKTRLMNITPDEDRSSSSCPWVSVSPGPGNIGRWP